MSGTERRRPAFGRLLRHWRNLRGLSQLALALRVETTTRHLSYVENGRSRPGRELILRLAEALDLPLRARNELLTAAGFAAEFPANELAGSILAPYRSAVQRLLDGLNPFPAFVIDSMFNFVDANRAGRRLLPEHGDAPKLNLIDVFLAPGPMREFVVNFAEVAWSWHARFVRATATLPESAELDALEGRLERYLRRVPRPLPDSSGAPVICPTFRIDGRLVRTIGMTMRFGPSRDVTLEELAVDVLFPRDAEAERFFAEAAAR
jgi:transcriptional regulator with XRE-family HTH domain